MSYHIDPVTKQIRPVQTAAPSNYSYAAVQPAPGRRHLVRNLALAVTCLFVFLLSFTSALLYDHFKNHYQNSFFQPQEDPFDRSPPSARMQALIEELDLTEAGESILVTARPEVFQSRRDQEYVCDRVLKSVTLGCWYLGKIYVLDSSDLEETLAHEFLHAVFFDERRHGWPDYDGDIFEALDEVYDNHRQLLEPLLEPYDAAYGHYSESMQEFLIYNELHSYIGTKIQNLPAGLEEHYGKYFKDRHRLIESFDGDFIGQRSLNYPQDS